MLQSRDDCFFLGPVRYAQDGNNRVAVLVDLPLSRGLHHDIFLRNQNPPTVAAEPNSMY